MRWIRRVTVNVQTGCAKQHCWLLGEDGRELETAFEGVVAGDLLRKQWVGMEVKGRVQCLVAYHWQHETDMT